MFTNNVRSLSLYIKDCPECHHLTIYGFWQQLDWQRSDDGVFHIRKCEECGHEDRLDWIDDGYALGAGI